MSLNARRGYTLPAGVQLKRKLAEKTEAIERVRNFANRCLEQHQRGLQGNTMRSDLHKPEVYRDILKVCEITLDLLIFDAPPPAGMEEGT